MAWRSSALARFLAHNVGSWSGFFINLFRSLGASEFESFVISTVKAVNAKVAKQAFGGSFGASQRPRALASGRDEHHCASEFNFAPAKFAPLCQ